MSRRLIFIALLMLALFALAVVPAGAQTGITWVASFYNNTSLSDPVILSRVDSAVAFNWGTGSPGTGVNADGFSARWGADPFFNAGTYRFYAQADDKVRVYVDYQPVPLIDTFSNPGVGQILSGDITLTQGTHHVQVDYTELDGNAYIYVTWANLATNPTGPNFPVPGAPILPSQPVSGPWTAQYYANSNLSGSPTLIQSETSPSHDWGAGSPVASIPADNFSARWTSVQSLAAGTYQINVRADDGVRVIIDGVTYINQFGLATGQTYTANVSLNAGQHSFIVEYFEGGGVAFLDFKFLPAGQVVATPQPNNPPVNTGAVATVTGAFRLNVRNAPSAITGEILTKINRNESYPIVGKNAAGTWLQINVNGVVGWVNARFVTATNAQNIPVTGAQNCSDAPTPRLVSNGLGRVRVNGLPNNMRQQPTTSSSRIGRIPPGATFLVISGPQCSSGLNWYQVNYNGLIGWTAEGNAGEYWIEPA